ncbi:MAG: hypothetical protein NTV01_14685, partial [Bacteroidia bacterium]|nr:hypothetical protein [Bacteroidia bacterium]
MRRLASWSGFVEFMEFIELIGFMEFVELMAFVEFIGFIAFVKFSILHGVETLFQKQSIAIEDVFMPVHVS